LLNENLPSYPHLIRHADNVLYLSKRACGTIERFQAIADFSKCNSHIQGVSNMRIEFKLLIDDVATGAKETIDRQSEPQADDELVLAANDNEIRWPLIPLPKDWYASPWLSDSRGAVCFFGFLATVASAPAIVGSAFTS
jgi:hypothetical protein